MPSCGFGPCKDSKDMGGAGCYLCDVVAKLGQPDVKTLLTQKKAPAKKPTRSTKKRG